MAQAPSVKPRTVWVGENTILGKLPVEWQFFPRSFPQRSPGSIFLCQLLGKVRWGQFKPNLQYSDAGNGLWYEMETWCSLDPNSPYVNRELDSHYITSSGRQIWRRHRNNTFPPRLP